MPLFNFSGLASGIDFNSIVDKMMTVERQPITLMEGRKARYEWQKEAWGEINTRLLALKTALEPLLDRDAILAMNTSSGDDSVVTAVADSDAASASYDISVTSLATSTVYRSGSGSLNLGIGGKIDIAQPVTSSAAKFGTTVTSGTFSINGISIEIDTDDYLGDGSGTDGNDLIAKINTALAGEGISAAYNSTTDKIELTDASGNGIQLGSTADTSNFLSATGLLAAPLEGNQKVSTIHLGRINPAQLVSESNFATPLSTSADGTGSFSINGVEIQYNANEDTLNEIITRINASEANVTAAYDSYTDQLVLTSKETGSLAVTRQDVTGNLLSVLEIADTAQTTLGTNAAFTVSGLNNGQPISSTSNTISDVINGVTFTLKSESASPVTISIQKDTESVKTIITEFVTKYNEAMDLINRKLSEKKDFEATTEAGRKLGILRSDSRLMQIKHELTKLVINATPGRPGDLDELREIGITRDSTVYGQAGKLVIDDAKLTKALQERPEDVAGLFFNDVNANGYVDATEEGLAINIDNYLDYLTDKNIININGVRVITGLIPQQQDNLSDKISDIEDHILDFEDRLEIRRKTLTAQFTALEKSMGIMQSQGQWLASQVSGLNAGLY